MSENTTPENTPDGGLPSTELLALRIRSLIADKEMVTATANMNIAAYGSWRCDYASCHDEIDQQIQALFLEANAQAMASADEKTPPKETTL
jgi:hypothetical protein